MFDRSAAAGMIASAVIALLLIAGTTSVSAHARRKSSTPEAGEVLTASPASVTIVFTQEIQKVSGTYGIDVTDESGTDVTAGDAVIDDADRTAMSVDLQPNLPNGRYVVMFRNVSDADGDEFEAGFAFYVGVEPTAEQLEQDAQLEPPEVSATQTFEAGGTPSDGTPAATPDPNATPAPGPDDDGGGSNTALVIVIVAVAAVAGIGLGFAAYRYLRSDG